MQLILLLYYYESKVTYFLKIMALQRVEKFNI
jgi:hypothetical protein